MLTFNEEEDAAIETLMQFMNIVQKEWDLNCNGGELAQAIHTLHMFIFQHALQRTGSPNGEWYNTLPRPNTDNG